jgi:hypothetical protein
VPRAARSRRAGFPTALIAAFILTTAIPADAVLPPPAQRLAAVFGRTPWQHDQADLPGPPWVWLVRDEGATDAG